MIRFYLVVAVIMVVFLSGNVTVAAAVSPFYFDGRDSIVKVNDVDLHIVDYGGSGETVVLVHGLTANARYWDALAERLIDRYHVVAIDLRGRGDSDKPERGYYDYQQYAEDIKGILDFYKIDRVIFIGHSMGAQVGVVFANQYSDRISRLVLVDAGLGYTPEHRAKIGQALKPALERLGKSYPNFAAYLQLAQQGPYYQGEWNKYVARYYWYDVQHQPDGSVVPKTPRYVIFPVVKSRAVDLDKLSKNISVPTLLLQAPGGLITENENVLLLIPEKARKLVSALPAGSRYAEIEGANHYSIILTKYEKVAKEVKDFLTKTGI